MRKLLFYVTWIFHFFLWSYTYLSFFSVTIYLCFFYSVSINFILLFLLQGTKKLLTYTVVQLGSLLEHTATDGNTTGSSGETNTTMGTITDGDHSLRNFYIGLTLAVSSSAFIGTVYFIYSVSVPSHILPYV